MHDDDGMVGRWLVGPRARDVELDPREVRSTSAGKTSASLNFVLNRRRTSYRTRSDLDRCAAVSEGTAVSARSARPPRLFKSSRTACEEDQMLRAVLVGMLREGER